MIIPEKKITLKSVILLQIIHIATAWIGKYLIINVVYQAVSRHMRFTKSE